MSIHNWYHVGALHYHMGTASAGTTRTNSLGDHFHSCGSRVQDDVATGEFRKCSWSLVAPVSLQHGCSTHLHRLCLQFSHVVLLHVCSKPFFPVRRRRGSARKYPLPTSSVWSDASPAPVWPWLWPVVPESIHARGWEPVLRCVWLWSDPVLVSGCEPGLRRCSGLATAVHPCSAVPGVPCRFRPASGQIPAPTSRWSAVPPHQSMSRLSDSRS